MDNEILKSAEKKWGKDRNLAEKMAMMRDARPSEWLMDEYIRDAKTLVAKVEALEKENRSLRNFLDELLDAQNGPPSEAYKDDWDKIMSRGRKLVNYFELKTTGGKQ